MCKVYNTIGSLTHIKTHLRQNRVEVFSSVNELLSFQKNYLVSREQIVSNQKTLLIEERKNLSERIVQLEQEIENEKQVLHSEIEVLRQEIDALANAQKTFIQEFTYSFKALFKLIRITYLQFFSKRITSQRVKTKIQLLENKCNRHQFLVSNFEHAVTIAAGAASAELDRKKRVIDEINAYIYGALGEQKVVSELKQLPDDYTLINDFTYTFDKPLYHKQHQTYVKTIQIDHLLVSPAGVFMIETKNWSKESVQSLNLRSPVAQIQRTSFALFILINRAADFKLIPHHWGERKIPIRNLIVLMNNKPKEEFQYVKILTLNELVSYVQYFRPTMSATETHEIAEYLVGLKT